MTNLTSRDLLVGLSDRSERLQQIQVLSNNVVNDERKIVEIDKKIKTAEEKIKTAEEKIKTAEKIIEITQKKLDANNEVIKNTEALIVGNEALIAGNEKSMGLMMELIDCYKALIANNNESQQANFAIDSNASPTTEEREMSTAAYEKAKQDLVDLNLDLKINNQSIKVVEKKSLVITSQSVDDSKERMTAYNILNDCFNNFRLKYLSSIRW